jgi:hypothetical protein
MGKEAEQIRDKIIHASKCSLCIYDLFRSKGKLDMTQ